jgi:ABC-2 type transport system ATP-binding protein
VNEIAITARNVSKKFVIHSERATSVKERLVSRRTSHRTFDALHDLSLEIESGTTVGLIGANGSGKSTTLKLLAGILRPTTGEVVTRGRIASLLELGAGFNGELSGRENVYLNASLLGLTRRETDGLFDEILAFSELEEFIDNPVKHYSSGMYVRLGFAVAVHVDPDILLVDEVLAVGDEHFARKCLDKISQFQREGRTILFVTHGLDLVEEICDRAVVLDHGNLMFDGDPCFATAALRRLLGTDLPPDAPDEIPDDTGVEFGDIIFSREPGGPPETELEPGKPMAMRVEVKVSPRWVQQADHLQVVITGVGNIPIWWMVAQKDDLPRTPGKWIVDFVVPQAPPVAGRFVAAIQLLRDDDQPIASHQTQNAFSLHAGQKHGLIKVDYHCGSAQNVVA